CPRERMKVSGRSQEIQRLIGRCLRTIVNLKYFGENTLFIDCDVIEADGGTRCASLNGAYLALRLACHRLKKSGILGFDPVREELGAVSVGKVEGKYLLDLSYSEDNLAGVDANFILTGGGDISEIQVTGEEETCSWEDFGKMSELAKKGAKEIIDLSRKTLNQFGIDISK
ncbi:MAG TPA: ribonuclease PH, partial [bacterium]|nr:ribonuclease PH [bacterium]